jgi:hypothetical protein
VAWLQLWQDTDEQENDPRGIAEIYFSSVKSNTKLVVLIRRK